MIAAARALSFMTGFLSLSQEILWMRLVSFTYSGAPQAFGVVLAVYLLGIAIGAEFGKRFCKSGQDLFKVAGMVLVVAALLDAIMPWLAVNAMGWGRIPGTLMLGLSVVVTAAGKSVLFPIVHHIGSRQADSGVGASMSKVYFANILGSTLGPLVTGFVLLQVMGIQQCLMLMAGLALLVGRPACCHTVAASAGRWSSRARS